MRTTIDIPEDLIKEAMKITRARTKTELIKYALYKIIQGEEIKELKKYKGKINLDIDLDSLRQRNAHFSR